MCVVSLVVWWMIGVVWWISIQDLGRDFLCVSALNQYQHH